MKTVLKTNSGLNLKGQICGGLVFDHRWWWIMIQSGHVCSIRLVVQWVARIYRIGLGGQKDQSRVCSCCGGSCLGWIWRFDFLAEHATPGFLIVLFIIFDLFVFIVFFGLLGLFIALSSKSAIAVVVLIADLRFDLLLTLKPLMKN